MNYKIEVTSFFKRQAKRLLKKYPSLKEELAELFLQLEKQPQKGDVLGNNCFKIRISINSKGKGKGKGKSGGARIITHVKVLEEKVYLLSIYDKSEQESLTEKELKSLLFFI